MKFKIENGTNICSIGMSDIGCYMRFNYPLTVVWYDCQGSVGKYFCSLPYNEEYRSTVRDKINNNLNEDFSNNLEGLYEILKPLFPIFKNGDYALSFYHNKGKELFQYRTSSDNFMRTHYTRFELVFAERTTDISNLEDTIKEHEAFLIENEISRKRYPVNILEYTTGCMYDDWHSFYATQPSENIDQDRVKYFEEKIRNGERPFALLCNAYFDSEAYDSSSYFILDGHHKLMAYHNLGLYPPVAVISHFPKTIDEIEFDAEKLAETMYPWQVEHILNHWDERDEYLERTLKNPKSILHSFIRNGKYKEYHENGQLKHKAFYINHKVDGSAKYWYKNGQLHKKHHYNKGLKSGTWKEYYESGKIKTIHHYNKDGRIHGLFVSYYENGQKRMEQVFENGRPKDGLSYKVWHENGARHLS